ncbi:carbon-nitrogen hydrolase family protein [Litorimonas sp. RW-G-Af-16]|uniref:carbon-nitrogen hydrolase family protein n=1 Tax=Litorimonas sp. RW-G-Af-16 TaxID=3241168 RepID=UPI00390CA49C
MKIALIQMRSGTEIAANILAASKAITQAAKAGARFIATPEMTHLLEKDPKALRAKVRPQDQDLGVKAFSTLAADLGVTLLIGSLAIKRPDGQIANRSFVFGPDGLVAARYDKIHLFEAAISTRETYREADTYTAGDTAIIAPVGELNLGLSICYDVRFADLYRGYAQAEVDMISVPAAFTTATGKAHWETLLRARAIETGAYILAPAQGGKHEDGRQTWGRSMVVDPWGKVIAKLDHNKPDILFADIHPKKVASARAMIPAWRS